MIVCENISKYYEVYKSEPGIKGAFKNFLNRKVEKKLALDDVSFSIERGRIVGLLGSNGAGKTTMLKILSGLILPSEGKVNVAGFTPFERKNEYRKKISFVMGQKSQLWWDLPAMQSFILNKHIYEIEDKAFNEKLNYLVDIFDIRDFINIQVRKLSFGQRMKCEIIGALLHSPEVIFLDEPTIGLDFEAQNAIRTFIKEYNSQHDITFIITSHYLNDIEIVCDDVIVLNKGQKIVNDSIRNVINNFSDHKLVSITFAKELPQKEIIDRFGEIELVEKNTLKIKIEKENINDLLSFCSNREGITDINIMEVPFEVVVKSLLSGKGDSYVHKT